MVDGKRVGQWTINFPTTECDQALMSMAKGMNSGR